RLADRVPDWIAAGLIGDDLFHDAPLGSPQVERTYTTDFIASSMISRPRSISSTETVSGGAMRHTAAIPPNDTMFMLRPNSMQRRVMAPPRSASGSRV